MQDIIQRGEMTITKVQTTHNPADMLTKHLPSATISSHLERVCLQTDNQTQAVNNLRGLPTSTTRTIGMIGLRQPIDTDGQPTVAETTTTSATSRSRAMRHSQAQQMRQRRRAMLTPPRNVQQRDDIYVAREDNDSS
eukprot:226830-Amphidinium_carterae.1